MKVVVTGGSGQLGSLVLERLAARGDVERVVSLDLTPPRVVHDKLDYRIADLRDPGLERHLEGAGAVVHLAFIVSRAPSREAMRAVNVDGTRAVLEACVRHEVRRVVYASSVAAYGIVPGHPTPIVESTPRRPTGTLDYADHKYEVEAILDALEAENPDIGFVRLRPGVLIGRRISHVPPALLRRRILPIVGDQRAPIVWDEDVADAAVSAVFSGLRGALNLVADDPITGEEMARLAGFRPFHVSRATAERLLRAATALGRTPADEGWIGAAAVQLEFSSERARRELGWRPRYPTAADVAIAYGKSAPTVPDRRLRVLMALAAGAARGAPSREGGEKLEVHLEVLGPTGADYALELDGGRVTIERGIPRPPDAAIALTVDTLLAVLNGDTSVHAACERGRITVRGRLGGRVVLARLVDDFREAARRPGPRGRITGRLSRWFAGRARG